MRKIIEYTLVSADGIVLDDTIAFQDYLDEAYLRDRLGVFESCDAILMGRATYERFVRTWAERKPTRPYHQRLVSMQKFVFSSKLASAEWGNAALVRGDVVAEIRRLKEQDGRDLLVLGHGLLGETLLEHRLLDGFDLTLHPILAGVGKGKPFLRPGQAANLKLVATRGYSKLVKVSYELQY